jgi:hypothetical protein
MGNSQQKYIKTHIDVIESLVKKGCGLNEIISYFSLETILNLRIDSVFIIKIERMEHIPLNCMV